MLGTLQAELNRLWEGLPSRVQSVTPKPKAQASLPTGGMGISYITPVGGAAEKIGKFLQTGAGTSLTAALNKLTGGKVPRTHAGGLEVSLRAREHEGGVPGVFRHEVAHNILRGMRVPQRGEDVLGKLKGTPQNIPSGQYYRLVEQLGNVTKLPNSREQRRRLSKQRMMIWKNSRRRNMRQ